MNDQATIAAMAAAIFAGGGSTVREAVAQAWALYDRVRLTARQRQLAEAQAIAEGKEA